MGSGNIKKIIYLVGILSVLYFQTSWAQLNTVSAGKKPSKGLVMKTSSVPRFEIYQKVKKGSKTETYRVKNIPKLEIGEEPKFQSNSQFKVELPAAKQFVEVKVIKRPTPEQLDIKKWQTPENDPENLAAGLAKPVFKIDPLFRAPVMPTLAEISKPFVSEPKVELTKMDVVSATDLKLLQALIFLEIKKSYNMALALFSELQDEGQIKEEATYQLAITSYHLGLFSEYKKQMLDLVKASQPKWQKLATQFLAENALVGDEEFVPFLDEKLEQFKIEITKADQFHINRAKYYMKKGKLNETLAALDEITLDSSKYYDAQFLKAVSLYRAGQLQEAITTQSYLLKTLEDKDPKNELRSMSALNLARMYFQSSQYKEAFSNYLKIDKKHPEWMQAMIEQAWSQILAEDYEGAAGNMFSLHSDIFKNTFAPESYVVRTVGYLNLCQYGDGARVIAEMKRKYSPVQKQLAEFKSNMSKPSDYYDTVKSLFRNSDQKLLNGLPRIFVYELARHPSFTNEQNLINESEDQVLRFNKIALDLIKQERELFKAQNEIKARIIDLKKKLTAEEKKTGKNDKIVYEEKRLLNAGLKLFIAKKARTSIKELRKNGLARLESEKTEFLNRAGIALQKRFGEMDTTLKNTLDQSEVLNYEIFSGAGEHIRYQMAGGEITDKEREQLKVEDNKALNWNFKGEIWEDELGHYRSSLKNVCPREDKVSQFEVSK